MPDETRTCIDCDVEYELTVAEQEWYREKGFRPPRRCPTCRMFNRFDQLPQKEEA